MSVTPPAPPSTLIPSRKVSVGLIGGAVTTIGLWILSAAGHIETPDYVSAAIVTVVSFVLSYLIPERDQQP